MKFYLLKYRVTSTNIISNAIETYDTLEDADSAYYSNLADAMSNNKLKYVMLSLTDSEGTDIKHDSVVAPGEAQDQTKYCLIEYIIKTDNTTEETLTTFNTLDAAKVKMVEDQETARNTDTTVSLYSTIIDTNGLIEITGNIKGKGYLDYKNVYIGIAMKIKTDNTITVTPTRYNTLDTAKIAIYRLISQSISDTTLFYIDCRIEDSKGNTLLHERKSCKGRIPEENNNE